MTATLVKPETVPEVRRSWAPYALIAPAMSGIGLFLLLPAVLSLVGSFFAIPFAPGQSWQWVGLDNYRWVLTDPVVHRAALNTVLYCVFTIVPSLVLGLGLALLVQRAGPLVRTALILPMTANLVAMAVVFRWIFALQGGVANQLLGIVGVAPINWLNDTNTSLTAVAIVGIWRGTSFTMLLFLAGLTTMPQAIHEAAAAEGIRGWTKLRRITLPMIKPTVVFATVLSVLTSVQVFDTINVMTQGGPQSSSETALTLTWKVGFGYFQLGKASALSFVLIAVLIGIGLLRRGAFAGGSR